MRGIRSLFGRRRTEPGGEVADAIAPATPQAVSATEPEPHVESGAAADPANVVRGERPGTEAQTDLPLRALNAYRHDPAYNNFMRRMKRAPGTPERRPRGGADAIGGDEGR